MFDLVSILDCTVRSPLLDSVQELPEDRPPEAVGQTAGHVVFDEGFDDSLSDRGTHHVKSGA